MQVTEFDLLANQIGVVRWVTCASPDFIECNGVPQSPAHVDPLHCIAVLKTCTDAAQQWLFRRKSETYTILPTAPLAFSDCDSAISAAVHGGGYALPGPATQGSEGESPYQGPWCSLLFLASATAALARNACS